MQIRDRPEPERFSTQKIKDFSLKKTCWQQFRKTNMKSNKPTTPPKTIRATPLYAYYVVGIAVIALSLIGFPGKPMIALAIILVVVGCLFFISTPDGRAFLAKHSERHLDQHTRSARSTY
jgi:hypothetical protein